MSLTVNDGDLILKDPADIAVYAFDWGTAHLATAVTITTSTFAVTAIRPSAATIPTITDSGSGLGIQTGSRSTKVKVTGGTLGALYELSNTIVTNETPAQTKNRMVRLKLENL
jgi:hypothetical protein